MKAYQESLRDRFQSLHGVLPPIKAKIQLWKPRETIQGLQLSPIMTLPNARIWNQSSQGCTDPQRFVCNYLLAQIFESANDQQQGISAIR
ncbi:hypothetical protein HI914_03140 [Erysiphe necator]|nr:hypothetical protein HI914_03140 [Erysiphe necator]